MLAGRRARNERSPTGLESVNRCNCGSNTGIWYEAERVLLSCAMQSGVGV